MLASALPIPLALNLLSYLFLICGTEIQNVRFSASSPCFLVKSLAWSSVDCESAMRATVALSAGVWKFVVICAMSTAGGASRMTILKVVCIEVVG